MAQLVEQLNRNQQVGGSSPSCSTIDESVRTIRTLIYRINRKIGFFLFLERNHKKGWCL